MKLNEEVKVISAESVVAVAKATELFIAQLANDAFELANENNRKTIKFEDIINVAKKNTKQLEFLSDAFEQSKMK